MRGERGGSRELPACDFPAVIVVAVERVMMLINFGGVSLVFDATMIGDLPKEVCAPKSGTDGVTQSCGLDVKEVALEVANIYWDESAV